ncbi:YqaJ viral recombinase family protein [Marinobacter sp.]|uniref:YqaJ viral recombinase family protein n=1 Tax=Marinobacter sp. TaxID=50741 RepID=UPI003A9107A5
MKFSQGKIVNLIQGSPEWLELRAKRFTASEAPAMMGKSKYQSRNDLLKQKATGLVPEVDAHTQRIFDDGHRAEAAARPIAEKLIGEELFPVVLDDAEGGFLASMDGLTMLGDIGWEHKMLNQSLAAQIDAGELDEHYRIQLDQQFALSGAERILFTASDGTEESCKHLWIERDESRFKPVESGWAQFAKDLTEYEAPESEQPKAEGKAPDALPALSVQVQGMVTASNLKEFEASARAALTSINTDLQSDQDFADAEKAVKFCKDVEKRLAGAKENVLGQMQTVDEVVKTIDRISEETRQLRLKLDKAVKEQKEARKLAILTAAREAWQKHLGELEQSLEREAGGLPITLSVSNADFAGAMKGKKTISSLQSACDDELARAKIEANETAELIRGNIQQSNEHAADYKFLFRDFGQICMKPADDFAAVVKVRIADYWAEQEAKAKREAEEAARREAEQMAQQKSAAKVVKQINSEESEQYVASQGGETVKSPAPARTPSANELIAVLCQHYSADRATVIGWLQQIDVQEAA